MGRRSNTREGEIATTEPKRGKHVTGGSTVVKHLLLAATASALLYAAPAEAGCSKSVVVYNAWWCPYCRQVRAILARNHIRYSVLDATSTRVQTLMVRRFGDTAVPRTIIGGVLVEGVDEARILQLCR
jgi:glutaredoxin